MGNFTYTNADGRWMRIHRFHDPKGIKPDVTLLPMIHIGEADYYLEMNKEAWCHDVLYYEGCWVPLRQFLSLFFKTMAVRAGLRYQGGGNRSKNRPIKLKGRSVTNAFELDEYITKLRCECGKCPEYIVRAIRADLHEPLAKLALASIPFFQKVMFPFLLIAAVSMSLFFSRKDIFDLSLEDADDEDASFIDRFMVPYNRFVRDDRDGFLQTVLHNEILAARNANKSLCVKYGALHMKALANFLTAELGYELLETRNVLAVKADKNRQIDERRAGYGIAHAAFTKRYSEKVGGSETKDGPQPEEPYVKYPLDMDIKVIDLEWLEINAMRIELVVPTDTFEQPCTYVPLMGRSQDYQMDISYPAQPTITDVDYDGLLFKKAEDAPDSDEAKEEV